MSSTTSPPGAIDAAKKRLEAPRAFPARVLRGRIRQRDDGLASLGWDPEMDGDADHPVVSRPRLRRPHPGRFLLPSAQEVLGRPGLHSPRKRQRVRCPFSCSACRSSWRRAPELAPMVLAQARRSRAVTSPPTPCTPTDGPFSSASTHRLTVTGNVVEIGCCPRRTDAFLRKLWRPLPPANPVAKLVHVRVVATIVHRRLLLLFALLQRHRYNVPPCLRHRRLNRGATHCKVWKSRAR
jgi:hypothetical protein